MPERTYGFGPELRRRRLAAGLTLDRLAALVHYSKSHLSKVETGQKSPTPELARWCDTALGAGGALAALVPERAVSARRSPASHDGEVWTLRMHKDGSSRFESSAGQHTAAAGTGPDTAPVFALDTGGGARPDAGRDRAGPGLALDEGGLRAAADAGGTTLIEASRAVFAQFRRLGQTAGPALLLPALIAQTHTTEQLALRSGPRTRGELLVLAARFAEYTGWMAQESGNDEAALWWTDRAVELAEAGDDRHLAAYGLVRRALVSLLRGDVAHAVGLAEHARDGDAPPRIRGLAAQHEAQGHALDGNYSASMYSLDRARELLALDRPDPEEPVIGASHVPDVVSLYTGWCLYHLGRPQRAADYFARETDRMPLHALRSRTRSGVRLALAHAASGQVEHACHLLRPLLGHAALVHSATIGADLRRTARILGRHPRNAAVRDLSPDLTAALTATAPRTTTR
ncbi:helix-turn-helix domain-containing protein [Streptomyces sp. NBC_01808]|uniref:helix-turn-helix transcriptional regulator n=1 Tax=Streptomyces sp. NBC_01808 TaxID=2975947 RepID=UPI002DDA92CA|nr:helix-turn-helix transcriptional regulator [Streptomyces sp. NBC_01808]WSA38411.1 helix-turn-helix domain-containing protein [Streptomyces sp. NBC_01808]